MHNITFTFFLENVIFFPPPPPKKLLSGSLAHHFISEYSRLSPQVWHQWQLSYLDEILKFGSCSWQICQQAACNFVPTGVPHYMYPSETVTLLEGEGMNVNVRAPYLYNKIWWSRFISSNSFLPNTNSSYKV